MLNWIADFIQHRGVAGVFLLLMTAPLPAEVIMPMVGYMARLGRINFFAAVSAGTAASEINAVVVYLLGRWIGLERLRSWTAAHGHWLALSPGELDRAAGWFNRWGVLAVIIGRAVPGLHVLICIPAGVARTPFWRFLIASTLGSLIWITVLGSLGLLLASSYARLQAWLSPLSWVVLAVCLTAYVLRAAQVRIKA